MDPGLRPRRISVRGLKSIPRFSQRDGRRSIGDRTSETEQTCVCFVPISSRKRSTRVKRAPTRVSIGIQRCRRHSNFVTAADTRVCRFPRPWRPPFIRAETPPRRFGPPSSRVGDRHKISNRSASMQSSSHARGVQRCPLKVAEKTAHAFSASRAIPPTESISPIDTLDIPPQDDGEQ